MVSWSLTIVWMDNFPLRFHPLQGLRVGQSVLLHNIGNDHGGTSGNSKVTVHQHGAALQAYNRRTLSVSR